LFLYKKSIVSSYRKFKYSYVKKKTVPPVKNYFKYFLALILFLLVLLTISGWLFVRNYKPILSEKLKEQVYIASDSLYKVNFSEVHLNPLLGKFTIDSFQLTPDTNTYKLLKKEHRAPPNLFVVFIKEFQLRHIHLWSLLRSKKVNIGIVKAENPRITVIRKAERRKKGNQKTIRHTLFNLTSGPLKSIKIDHIGLHNIYFTSKNEQKNRKSDPENIQLKNMELIFKDIRIDSSTLADTSRFLFAKKAWFHLAESKFFLKDSLYEITTNGIGYSIVDEKALIRGLKITPQYSERDFDRQLTYRKALFTVSADSLILDGLGPEELDKRNWHLKGIGIRQFDLDVYLNRSNPLKPGVKPLLQQALKNISEDLLVERLYLKGGNIKYRELKPISW